jgi:hypothetical protein
MSNIFRSVILSFFISIMAGQVMAEDTPQILLQVPINGDVKIEKFNNSRMNPDRYEVTLSFDVVFMDGCQSYAGLYQADRNHNDFIATYKSPRDMMCTQAIVHRNIKQPINISLVGEAATMRLNGVDYLIQRDSKLVLELSKLTSIPQ